MAYSTASELSLEDKAWRLAEQGVGLVLRLLAQFIFTCILRLWRVLKYVLFGFTYKKIVYGKANGREIFDTLKERNLQTIIIGKPGSGKSGLAANIGIQAISNGTCGIFIDPHGNPFETDEEKKGAIVKIYERARDTKKVVFFSITHQKDKIIGSNILFLIAPIDTLNKLKDELMNGIFHECLEEGHLVANRAKFLIESVLYAHNCYRDWLKIFKRYNTKRINSILYSHQITLNDINNLKPNGRLIDLFITLLGFEQSKYYRPDLVEQWQEIKQKKKFDVGLLGAIGRLAKIVSTSLAELFFESSGFNVIQERLKGNFVLCDSSGLDHYTRSCISKLVYVKVHTLHVTGIIKSQTEFMIDEAPDIELPNYDEVLSQGRKFKLALTCIFQYMHQFEDSRTSNALKEVVVNKIIFQSEEKDLGVPKEKLERQKDRECTIMNRKGTFEGVRTLDLPKIRREVQITERGVAKKALQARMTAKKRDIYSYFMKV